MFKYMWKPHVVFIKSYICTLNVVYFLLQKNLISMPFPWTIVCKILTYCGLIADILQTAFIFVWYCLFYCDRSLTDCSHDDVIKWKHYPPYCPFVRGIHRSPVNSPHKGHWRGALMFSLIYGWTNGWVNNRKAGDLRHHRAHYDAM